MLDKMHEPVVPHQAIMNEEEKLKPIFLRILVLKASKSK
jgi:hypothetical protein